MKLKRMNVDSIFNTNLYEVYNGKYVEWTLELQEAWDKQQEREVIYIETDSVYRCMCPNCKVKFTWHRSKHCSRCGQKLAW